MLLALAPGRLPARDVVDTRGPVLNAGMQVSVDRDGVQAPGYVWSPPGTEQTWTASWIEPSVPTSADALGVCLRKEVVLSQEPRRVTARLTGNPFLLYLNGRAAARGPADAGRDFVGATSEHRFFDRRDLTAYFHKGVNALAVEIWEGRGFQFEAVVEYPDGRSETIRSDASWKGISNPYLRRHAPPATTPPASRGKGTITVFDAEAEPVGWQFAGFNDSAWPACRRAPPPADTLVESELPPLMEVRYPYFQVTDVVGDVTVPHDALRAGSPIVVQGSGQFVVQFDRVMAGRCGLAVRGGAGATVELTSNETKAAGGRRYEVRLRDGLQYFESRDYYALGAITVKVTHATRPVEIEEVSADFLSQPVSYRGSFVCSDDALNTLWKSGRWSTQICMITHHLDSPQHQEPISDYGDYLIADLVNYYAMGDNLGLARQDLRKWSWVMKNAHDQTFHTSYLFYWLQALVNEYDYSGDPALVRELAPDVHAMIDQFISYLGKNGLISEAPNYMFMDWATVSDDRDPSIRFACHHPPAVIGQGYMTALFYRALADAIRVCAVTNDPVRAEKYASLRRQIAAAYSRELWNPVRGQYRDGKPFVTAVKPGKWLPADVAMESFSVQNNALAVLTDLAQPERRATVIATMNANPTWDVTPYFMHFVFEAYGHAGLFDRYALARLHDYQVVPTTQTVREMGPGKGDYSHGWTASPTYQMSSKILGVTPTLPGFAAFTVHPTLCGLTFARGVIPSPHGPILVDWRRAADRFSLTVTIPPGTGGEVSLPVGAAPAPQVSANGVLVWKGTKRGDCALGLRQLERTAGVIRLRLAPGTYTLVATGLSGDEAVKVN